MGGSAVTRAYRDQAYAVNVTGTRNVIEASERQGVTRLIHTSSVDTCFNSEEDLHIDEHTPYATRFTCVYTETKIAAEQAIFGPQTDTTVCRPAHCVRMASGGPAAA